jgi:hypothetical protein
MNKVVITTKNGLGLSGINPYVGATGHILMYDQSNNKITYSTSKTFVIDHPEDEDKLLVHACLEGPEAGVYYRGKSIIENGKNVTIVLPSYVSKFAKNFTIHLTPMYDESTTDNVIILKPTDVNNSKFTVYGPNCMFNWIVYGERLSIEVEPLKSAVEIKGDGPYKWV